MTPMSNPRTPQSPASDQRLNDQVRNAERPGLVGAVHVHGGAFVASVAMHHAIMLSRTADAAFRVSPLGEDTYRSILMAFGTLAVNEIQGLAFQNSGLSS
jgi:hypothetical protein